MDPLPVGTSKEFLFQFQKLVCLDYIIRNTGTVSYIYCYLLSECCSQNMN